MVVASPCTVDFSPPYAVRYGGIGVVSKIDRWVYVGVEEVAAGSIVALGQVSHFVPEGGAFAPWKEPQRGAFDQRLPKLLGKYVSGIALHIVSEFPFYRGLNLDSTIAVGIAAATLLRGGQITVEALNQMTLGRFEDLRNDEAFTLVFTLAWQIEALLSQYRPEGHQIHAALTRSHGHTVFWRKSMKASHLDAEGFLRENPFSMAPWGFRLEELGRQSADQQGAVGPSGGQDVTAAGLRSGTSPQDQFDACVLSLSELECDSAAVFANHRIVFRKGINDRTRQVLDSIPPSALAAGAHAANGEDRRTRFFQIASGRESSGQSGAADCLMDFTVVQSTTLFASVLELFRGELGSDQQRAFMRGLSASQDLYRLFNLSLPSIDNICSALARSLNRDDERAAVRLLGPGLGGSLLVMSRRRTLEPAIERALADMPKEFGERLTLVWSSFGDGYARHGECVHVVQHLPTKRLPIVSRHNILVRGWMDGRAQPLFSCDSASWRARMRQYDVILDFQEESLMVTCRGSQAGNFSDGSPSDAEPESLERSGGANHGPKSAAEARLPQRNSSPRARRTFAVQPRTTKLLDLLFRQVATGDARVSLDRAALEGASGRKLQYGAEIRRELGALKEARSLCGIEIKEKKGGLTQGMYRLLAEPDPSVRVAILWAWPDDS